MRNTSFGFKNLRDYKRQRVDRLFFVFKLTQDLVLRYKSG